MWKKIKSWVLRLIGGRCFNCNNRIDLNYSIIFLKLPENDKPVRIRFCGKCTDEFLHKTEMDIDNEQ